MAVIDEIRDRIRREFLFDSNAELSEDQTLFPDLIDSLDIMVLVDFIEERWGLEIDEDELVADNFASLGAVASLIERKSA